ncbi:MAG: hypothetical protein QXI16_02015 [Sulfolobaceae archaeon]
MKKLINQFIYIDENNPRVLMEPGIFIAVKLINLFIQTYISNAKITYSNDELIGKMGCSRSGLYDAFRVLEREGLIKRIYSDTKKRNRTEIEFNIDLAASWLKLTIYDKVYKNAPKRSLLRAVVSQTMIIIKDTKERILEAVGVRKSKDRKERIEQIVKETERNYNRYVKHLKQRKIKQDKINATRKESILRHHLILGSIDWIKSLGLGPNPPDTLKTA